MNKPSFDLPGNARTSQGQTVLFGNIMAVLMMVILAAAVVLAGERLFPEWQGGYLVWVCLFISIEAITTRKHAKELEGRDKIFFRISEWIAIAVALKLLLYLIHGPAQLLRDLPLWQEDFVPNFFTGEYMLALVVAALVWFSSAGFSGDLESLYDRDMDTRWDELGKLQNVLRDVRRRITTRIFIIGSLVVVLAVVSHVDASAIFRSSGKPIPGNNAPVILVLAYFILALVLLSQTQFALLRIRWLWQQMPISPSLAKNWIKYGLLFFIVLAVIVFFLPTNYSIGLLDTLRYVLEYFLRFVSFLVVLIALPFTFCLSLFKLSTAQNTQQPEAPPPMMPPQAAPGQPVAWLEFIRSLAFWIIFLGVIIFALRFYLTQNVALWKAITAFPLFRWIAGAWQGFWKWVKGANRQIAGLVQTGIKRLRAQRVAAPAQAIRRIFNFARLSPREKIIYFYLNLIEFGGERGLERKPSQTPYQYETCLDDAVPEVSQELHGLTDTFVEARYSRHPVEQPHAERAHSFWERIKTVLKEWKRED